MKCDKRRKQSAMALSSNSRFSRRLYVSLLRNSFVEQGDCRRCCNLHQIIQRRKRFLPINNNLHKNWHQNFPCSSSAASPSGSNQQDIIDNMKLGSKLINETRALDEFCLSEKDLIGLAQYKRRSAKIGRPPSIMYYKLDVERKAIEVHGSREALKAKQDQKALLNTFFLEPPVVGSRFGPGDFFRNLLDSKDGRVVLLAVGVNALNCIVKFVIGFYTGSHSLKAEAFHSLADFSNQILVAYGIHRSIKQPDKHHPYGYMNYRHVTSLASGVGFFFGGAALSLYQGFQGLVWPNALEPLFWAFAVLAFSFCTEGGTLIVAAREASRKAKEANMSLWQYVRQGDNPSLIVVLLEDSASVLGVGIATLSLYLSSYVQSSLPDAVGSLLIGGLLTVVAGMIIYTNSAHLVGRSIPEEETEEIVKELEKDPIIRSVQDVKTTALGGDQTRFKAEIDLNGYEVTQKYLQSQDLNKMFQEIQTFSSKEDLERFMLTHGEQLVDCVGAELDRIEKVLKAKYPELRHLDLEVL